MSTPPPDQIARAIIEAFPKLSGQEQCVAVTLYRLLAKGYPVTAEQISAASGISRDAVSAMLEGWHGVQRNADGAVMAFWGLTLSKTTHRFRINGRELHTWCAWDTLFLPPLLGATAEVESTCPGSGERITLRIGPRGIEATRPETAVLSFLTPTESDVERNIIENFCCHVHFFVSVEAGKPWVARHPGTFLLSLDDAWHIGVRKNLAQYEDAALAIRRVPV